MWFLVVFLCSATVKIITVYKNTELPLQALTDKDKVSLDFNILSTTQGHLRVIKNKNNGLQKIISFKHMLKIKVL